MSNTLHATIATDALTMAVQSMSRARNCYQIAMMESLCATLKKELVHNQCFHTHNEARSNL